MVTLPSASVFFLKIHLFSMARRSSGKSVKVHTLAEQLDGRKAVEYRWILKGRRTMMVNVTIKKARLVVKKFPDKVQGVDYDETFSLVAMLRVCWNYISDCCIIYEILQIGCQNIVSSTIFEERLYVIQPEGFVNPERC